MNIKQEAAQLWRLWSVKLAAVAGLVVAYVMSDPMVLQGIVAAVPEQWRPLASIMAGFATFAAATLARRVPQKPKL